MCIARNKHNYTSQGAVEIKVLGKFYFVDYLFRPRNVLMIKMNSKETALMLHFVAEFSFLFQIAILNII